MVKRTYEVFECDVCGEGAQRYSLSFEDGTLNMDRCVKHAQTILELRDGPGEWHPLGGKKSTFRKSTPLDIQLAVVRHKKREEEDA